MKWGKSKKIENRNIPWEDQVERAMGLESRRSPMLPSDVAEKSGAVLNSFIWNITHKHLPQVKNIKGKKLKSKEGK